MTVMVGKEQTTRCGSMNGRQLWFRIIHDYASERLKIDTEMLFHHELDNIISFSFVKWF
jgi:hypothetical protein